VSRGQEYTIEKHHIELGGVVDFDEVYEGSQAHGILDDLITLWKLSDIGSYINCMADLQEDFLKPEARNNWQDSNP